MCSNSEGLKSPILYNKFKYSLVLEKNILKVIWPYAGMWPSWSCDQIKLHHFGKTIHSLHVTSGPTYKISNYLFHFFTEKPKQKSTAGKKRELPPPPVGQYHDV